MKDSTANDPTSTSSWWLPAAFVVVGAFAWACQDVGVSEADDAGDDGVGEGEVSRRDVLHSIAHQVVVPATAEFAVQAAALEVAVDAWAADPTDEAQLAAVQEAWTVASASWQHLEMLQIGPAASSLVGIGGEDLRDAIYSWPTTDTCVVDRALVAQDYASPDFFVTELVWAYGLDALEYLLFSHAETHTCPSQVQLDPTWTALSFEQIEQRRAAYARVVVAGVAEQARTLAMRWSPEGDDFAAALAGAGEDDSPYESDVQALDEVFRAMFYLDKQAKDGKLGIPLGLVEGCAAVPCIEMMEAPQSGVGAASIRANLEALRVTITGGPDPDTADGFDDLLIQLGHAEIAESVLTDIDLAIAQADALTASPQQIALADPDDLLPLHAAVKRVTDALKGPFTMALMLTIPAEGAGDND